MMPTESFRVWVRVPVDITIHDPDVIDRVVHNHDDEGRPQPLDRPRGSFTLDDRGWRDTYYDMPDRDAVLRHLAFNAVVNGADGVSRLDGWADMPDDACTMDVARRSAEFDTPVAI